MPLVSRSAVGGSRQRRVADRRLGEDLLHIPTSEEEDVPDHPDPSGLKSLNTGALVDFSGILALAWAAGVPPEARSCSVFEA